MKVKVLNTIVDVSALEVVRFVAGTMGYVDVDVECDTARVTIKATKAGAVGHVAVSGKTENEACLNLLHRLGLT
jgi:hypothetical protein